MNNKLVLGQYYDADSWLHRLDPRTKLVTIFLVLISLFLLKEIYSLLIALGLVLILLLTSKIPFAKFIASLKAMTMILFLMVFFQILFNRGSDVIYSFEFILTWINLFIGVVLFLLYFYIGKFLKKLRFLQFLLVFFLIFFMQTIIISPFVITKYNIVVYRDSLTTSLVVILRILSLIFVSSLLTLTTKPADLNMGLESLFKPLKYIGIKVSIFTMMISITLRFIPTLFLEAQKILKAQASRGVDFKESKLKQKVTQIISLLLPMFVISIRKAYDLADAMEVRGYIPGAERTSINILKFRFSDVVVFFIVISILTGLIMLNVMKYAI
ncbi:MAG: energy-coupling factor transporter transmembrane protein EcfT [Bacilli bacterium]|nr:energy-coupling factor transporter transmembrane protein EcfT [Bacilli bacterium]MDD4076425.1 energy-coupling factor transporter transmembrane protein EcfT [Bacilli bacterium]MDD4387775.1 energy-coupling factor transporter transmembrane protein EcfT [Bacilli bacterium]